MEIPRQACNGYLGSVPKGGSYTNRTMVKLLFRNSFCQRLSAPIWIQQISYKNPEKCVQMPCQMFGILGLISGCATALQ